ncbi:bifunctional homocysteine S-methyltransferase/methylenetetrahydrofolate reductase [Haliangium sp.]|uniref:bifunctional homocysteine S-methyltransferase/methylenetetrahydrofolate reductase n=1 Tax=Haliangium sp. TaxID=2663208 RepID=UPI003D13BC25
MSRPRLSPFLEVLEHSPLLFDGAMGSLLYDRGVFHTRSYDELNLSQPSLIRAVHREYLEAGAQILETNTFGANRITLARHGHAERVAEINRAAVALARKEADDRAYIAGAIGPTGVRFAIAAASDRRRAREALAEQIAILAEAGVDLLVLETFTAILEMETAIEIAREVAPTLPVVAQMVFDAEGQCEGCLSPEEVARRLREAGADVVGANCGVGPAELYAVGTKMLDAGAPVAIQPNAGFPSIVDSRTIYVANPEHFGVFARRMLKSGIRLVGGCCGTTPAHVRTMLGAVRMHGGTGVEKRALALAVPGIEPGEEIQRRAPTVQPEVGPVVPLAERSRLGARIASGTFAVSVELTSPPGTNADALLGRIRTLLEAGVDIVNIADGPRASARMGNLAACATALMSTGVEPILHVCARDRNFLGLVAHLLGAHALGMRDLVMITGDPPKMGDYPFATPVYDVDSIGLLGMAAALNCGFDPAGKEIDGHTSFVLATGAEPAASDYERELRRLEQKRAAGAELVMTQPVYDPRVLERFLDDVSEMDIPVMVGVLPLASHRNAEFLHNEVPGMQIPEAYRERMAKVGSGPEARAEGVRIAQEALAAVKDRVAGVYIMPPFNRVEAAVSVLEVVRDRWQPAPMPALPGLPGSAPSSES